ncbi:MAG: hypothetical protein JOY58_09215 [Solirubrobacterales bacterium]|nr:hypothetical protein [Solirubrobacterales bacterium]
MRRNRARITRLLLILSASVIAGCSSRAPVAVDGDLHHSSSAASTATATATAAVTSWAAATRADQSTCRYRRFSDGAIGADPGCTPGALNPAAVADPYRTICQRRYLAMLAKVEASVHGLKVPLMIRYGSAGNASTYVLAQRLPAEDGGSPTNPDNLWPMPVDGWGGALTESAVANSVHEQICEGKVTVRQAARFLEGDWLRRGIPDDD